jgi:RecB family exonuclease
MIVRILGEGQLRVDDSATDELNVLDAALGKAVNAGDEQAFRSALAALLDRVRSLGTPLAEDAIEPSDLILPYSDAGLEDVRGMMAGEGLIPG